MRTRLLKCIRRGACRVFSKSHVPATPLDQLDLLFGTRAIARYMGLSRGQARSLVVSRQIPCFELGGVTCARRSSIQRHLLALETAGAAVKN